MRIIQLIKTMIIKNENYPTNKNNDYKKIYPTNKNNDYKKMRIIQLIKTMIIRKWELSN